MDLSAEAMKQIVAQGVWAVLFVALLVYVVRANDKRECESKEREKAFMEFIRGITPALQKLADEEERLAVVIEQVSEKVSACDFRLEKARAKI